MICKHITFTDYLGKSRTKDYYFHFNKAELAEMEMSVEGGLEQMLKKIMTNDDRKSIVQVFKRLILDSYGEISPDGERFVKSKELRDAFEQSEAYAELFMELSMNSDAAYEFVMGVVPANIAKAATEIQAEQEKNGNLNSPIDFPIQTIE